MGVFDDDPVSLEDYKRSFLGHLAIHTESLTFGVESLAFPNIPTLGGYSFMFADLQHDPANLLQDTPKTASDLIVLGKTLIDSSPADTAGDSGIPSAYTYFGQFIDHDITRLMEIKNIPLLGPETLPLRLDQIGTLSNVRSSTMDLDSVYGPAVEHGGTYDIPTTGLKNEKLKLAPSIGDGPVVAVPDSDLPRDKGPVEFQALIGDRKNDGNIVINQLQVAFIRAHNALIDQGNSFQSARQLLRRLYQYIVINDYLPRMVGTDLVKDLMKLSPSVKTLTSSAVGRAFFDPSDDPSTIPLEFTGAAFRCLHPMPRTVYHFNNYLTRLELRELSLHMPDRYRQIMATWLIDWNRFLDREGGNKARLVRPQLSPDLKVLANGPGQHKMHIGVVDLLKGFLLRLPTGQAVADYLGKERLSVQEITSVTTSDQREAMAAGGFDQRTPLLLYLLMEAAARGKGRFGEIGGTIVASVLIGLVRSSKDSYLRFTDWSPPFGKGKDFDLSDLLELADVLPKSN